MGLTRKAFDKAYEMLTIPAKTRALMAQAVNFVAEVSTQESMWVAGAKLMPMMPVEDRAIVLDRIEGALEEHAAELLQLQPELEKMGTDMDTMGENWAFVNQVRKRFKQDTAVAEFVMNYLTHSEDAVQLQHLKPGISPLTQLYMSAGGSFDMADPDFGYEVGIMHAFIKDLKDMQAPSVKDKPFTM